MIPVRRWVSVPAGRLFAWQWGAGPDLVVLPGVEEALLSRAALGWVMGRWWAPFARRYGMRVTALAARESVPPEFTTQQMGQDAAAALEALGMRPAAIVGVGAGGAVAEWAAAEVALRGSAAPALILLSVPAGLRTTAAQAGFYDHLVRLLRGTSPEQAFDHLCGLYLDADLGRRHRLMVKLLRRWGRSGDVQRAVRLLGAWRAHDARPIESRLRALPILMVSGGFDALVLQEPANGQRGAPVLRPARHVWLAGEHGAFLAYWETVTAEMARFARERAPAYSEEAAPSPVSV